MTFCIKETTRWAKDVLINSKHPGRRKTSRIWKASNLRETRIACKQGYSLFSSAEDVSGDIRLTDAKPGRGGLLPLLRERIALSLALEKLQSYAAKHLTRVCTQHRFVQTYPGNETRCLSNQITTASLRVVILAGGAAFHRVFHPSFLFFYPRSRKLKRPTPPRVDITDGRRCVHLHVKEMLRRNFFIHKTMDCSPRRRKIRGRSRINHGI